MTAPRKVLWHYTPGKRLDAILRSRVLRVSHLGSRETGEVPAVWFSLRQDWDPAVGGGTKPSGKERSAFKDKIHDGGVAHAIRWANRAGPEVAARDLGGLARIGVPLDVAPHTWDDFVRLGGISRMHAWARHVIDRELGSNPEDWRLSFVDVPATKWISVERRSGTRRGERWEPVAP